MHASCIQGRAIATFRTRRQAHLAITRLHGRETLAGLRMRLFYLHEQQQRQHLLSQTPQSLITSVGQLSLDTPSPAAAAALAHKEGSGSSGLFGQAEADSAGVSGTGNAAVSGGSAEEGVLSSRSSFEKDQGPVVSQQLPGWHSVWVGFLVLAFCGSFVGRFVDS